MLSSIAAVIIGGQAVARWGRYWPSLIAGPPLAAIGAGLLYTVDERTEAARVVGWQLLAGVGLGGTMQNGVL